MLAEVSYRVTRSEGIKLDMNNVQVTRMILVYESMCLELLIFLHIFDRNRPQNSEMHKMIHKEILKV